MPLPCKHHPRRARHFASAIFALLALVAFAGSPRAEETALDRYLAKPDPSYKWSLAKTIPGAGVTTYVIDLKSQTWRTTADVDRTLWEHWLLINKPDQVKTDTSLLLIGGGGNGKEPPGEADASLVKMASETGAVISELKQVPNQPLIFGGDGVQRSEDDIIGYTWDKFMTTGDETWPLRLPMVKSAHRAMDTIQAFLKSPEGGAVKVEKFVVAGGSKRGWTTWLTGATDKRVCAIVPIVIDVLNVGVSMQHHYEAYGFWSPAVGNYVQHHIPERTGTPEHTALMKIEDPYNYRDRLTMPKLVMNASGDEFFLPDSSQFYYPDLKGEKLLRYVPNAKHSLGGSDARESLQAFFELIVSGKARPRYSWTKEPDGSLRVKAEDKPREVKVWRAVNPEARDFRLDKIGKAYQSAPLEDQGGGVYYAKAEKPEKGFAAFFVELTFDTGGTHPLKVTSEVSVVPDVLPFKGKPFKKGDKGAPIAP